MIIAAGIDGYPKGWVAVVLQDGRFHYALVSTGLADLVERLGDAAAIGLDMPVGLPETGPREADRSARLFIGPRRSSVFPALPRAVCEAPDYEAARDRARRLTGRSISRQAWALRHRTLEADAVARGEPRLREVHPEVSFRALAGEPLAWPKSTWAGIVLRRRLLAEVGIEIPDDLGPAGAAGVDDVLDAAAVAWSATRIAAGTARSLPERPTVGPDGHIAAIWY